MNHWFPLVLRALFLGFKRGHFQGRVFSNYCSPILEGIKVAEILGEIFGMIFLSPENLVPCVWSW